MSASAIVPLTVTYTPSSGAAVATATVLGQVLNDGATNWVPTGGSAIYLYTSSGSGESQTVLGGTTYFLSDGPAVPDQATGVTIVPSSTAGSTAAGTSTASTSEASAAATSTSMSASASSTSSSSSASASSSHSGAGRNVELGRAASVLLLGSVFVWIAGVVAM